MTLDHPFTQISHTGFVTDQGFLEGPDAARTIGPFVRDKAVRNGDKRFVEVAGRAQSYADIHLNSDAVLAGLQSLSLEPGDHVCLMMNNSVENIWCWFALCKGGILEVPINTAYKGYLLSYIINQSDACAIIIDADLAPRLEPIASELPNLRHVIVNGRVSGLDLPSSIQVHDLASLRSHRSPTYARTQPSDTSVILYTSGTTGPSKGVILSHEANLNLARHCVWLMGYGSDDVLYTVFPLFHINAKYTSVMAAMEANASLVMDQRFSASTFWDKVRAKGVTAFNYQGALLLMLYKQPPRPDDADNPVRIAFGAPCPADIWRPFEERFGLTLVEVYGMTEIAIATENRPGETKVGTAGKESANFWVRIFDENDRPCPPGVAGEIVVRPKRPNVMFKGYYRQEEFTLDAFRNLWFHTGDRGVMDSDGYITFIDRMKDCIRRRGENISSFEVEAVVNSHDAVLESAAYGVASDLSEEEVMVAVVVKEGQTLTPHELLDFCQTRMAHFAVPRYVRFVAELPKTPSQRIQKYLLREEGITPDTWDRDAAGYRVRRE
ncbi:MAG: ATP-dependent acyl-CoA ligase [Acidimicrobiia bacterium]|nr:MAG: ATP-dependent acyl-CoA ligase [Acidimicrobiia bacterium]